MFKRIFSWLLVLALLLGMTGNVLAAESKPAVSQIVTMQNQEGVTVRLTVPGGAGSGNGRLVYQFPKELTLKGAKSLVGSEGISNLGTSDTSVSFAWTCYEDYAAETAILELSFAGAVGVYQGFQGYGGASERGYDLPPGDGQRLRHESGGRQNRLPPPCHLQAPGA